MYTLERRGYGTFAHGSLRELWYKARHEAREFRRAVEGTGIRVVEKFRIRDAHGNVIAQVDCIANFEPYLPERCKRLYNGKAIYRYRYKVWKREGNENETL